MPRRPGSRSAEAALVACVLAGCGRFGFDGEAVDAPPPVWTAQAIPSTSTVFDITAAGDQLVAVADDGMFRSPGDGTWSELAPFRAPAYGVFATSEGVAYGVGNLTSASVALVARISGSMVAVEDSLLGRPLNDGCAVSPSDLYAVGYSGNLLHSPGDGTWSAQVTKTTQRLLHVWCASATDLYAVGDAGTILHSNGSGGWEAQVSGTTANLFEVWGRAADDIYAVGAAGTILHSTGDGTWTPEAANVAFDLLGVHGDATRIYAVGRASELVTSAGDGAWTALPLGVTVEQLDAVFVRAPREIYLVGRPGIVLRGP